MAADANNRYHASDPDGDDDEAYDENADEDFHPEPAAAVDSEGDQDLSSSDSEAADAVPSTQKRSTKRKPTAQASATELDSGDEATIRERRPKRRKKTKGVADSDDDSGGEGGWIRTRAQRVVEKEERRRGRRVAAADGEALVTIDVDAIWAELSARPVGRDLSGHARARRREGGEEPMEIDEDEDEDSERQEPDHTLKDDEAHEGEEADMITITRRIAYAGEETEVRERVPRTSKRARDYLALHPEAASSSASATQPSNATAPLNRPLKRPSRFEPNPGAIIKGVAPEKLRSHPHRAPTRLDAVKPSLRPEKMTTVQKSAVDWQGFVAGTEGLAAELVEYGKSKAGFLAREEFLDRAQGAREQRARDARLKG